MHTTHSSLDMSLELIEGVFPMVRLLPRGFLQQPYMTEMDMARYLRDSEEDAVKSESFDQDDTQNSWSDVAQLISADSR